MRVLVDANIIISAGLFSKSVVGLAFAHIAKNHDLVLCQYTLDELKTVFKNKFPEKTEYLNRFLKELKYELIDFKIKDYKKYPKMRDIADMPLLANAVESQVDLLITGDKDFNGIVIEKPQIISPRQYINEYL